MGEHDDMLALDIGERVGALRNQEDTLPGFPKDPPEGWKEVRAMVVLPSFFGNEDQATKALKSMLRSLRLQFGDVQMVSHTIQATRAPVSLASPAPTTPAQNPAPQDVQSGTVQ